ncbi:RidA family protein [Caulobacter sp. S45]|uniref:RidA family protein n=1 Tax=Caulobacter sp. S45 TaxID=1641861 RepID=UPI0015773DE1|nr:RidA family protein [Caulobacter sp. S45]
MRASLTRGLCALSLSLAAVQGLVTPALAAPIVRVSAGSFPISSAVVVPAGAQTVYISGTTAPAPAAGASMGDTEAQTVGALGRIQELLKAQGLGLGDVVMMRVFLTGDPAKGGHMDFPGMMAGYTQFFGTAAQPNKPARTTVQVAGLAAPGAMVEIEVQAAKAP